MSDVFTTHHGEKTYTAPCGAALGKRSMDIKKVDCRPCLNQLLYQAEEDLEAQRCFTERILSRLSGLRRDHYRSRGAK